MNTTIFDLSILLRFRIALLWLPTRNFLRGLVGLELERAVIRERVMAGLARAKAAGERGTG